MFLQYTGNLTKFGLNSRVASNFCPVLYKLPYFYDLISCMIVLKQHSQAAEETIGIGVHPVPQGVLPKPIFPKGLNLDQQWYLYDKVRPLCSSTLLAVITCPMPSQPKPSAMAPEHIASDSTSSASVTRAGTKRKPVTCSSCKCEGHTNRTCPLKK